MGNQTVFLVYGFDDYEYPCHPIKAFVSEADAQALLAEIVAYQAKKPAFPDGRSAAELDAWEKALAEWRGAHPSGDAEWRDGFSVMLLVLVEPTP